MNGPTVGESLMTDPLAIPGVVHLPSPYPVESTLERLEARVRERGLTVFARIEFSRDAAAVGLTLRPMIQLIFGNPRAGTPLLAASPPVGLALPLRALAWEDAEGRAWLSYEAPDTMAARFGVPQTLQGNLAALATLCAAAVTD
jgi:uncharacterized protein (DUF302 family)